MGLLEHAVDYDGNGRGRLGEQISDIALTFSSKFTVDHPLKAQLQRAESLSSRKTSEE